MYLIICRIPCNFPLYTVIFNDDHQRSTGPRRNLCRARDRARHIGDGINCSETVDRALQGHDAEGADGMSFMQNRLQPMATDFLRQAVFSAPKFSNRQKTKSSKAGKKEKRNSKDNN